MRAQPLGLALLITLGCGGQAEPEQPAEPAPAPPPAAEAPAEHAHPAPPPDAPMPAAPPNARVFFVAPRDGEQIVGKLENGKVAVSVKMGAENIAVQPAGEVAAGSGHHHVLVDAEPVAQGTVVPKDEQHLHFGQAQTEATLALSPGPHVLQLQLADGVHRSYGPQLSAKITVTVAAEGSVQAAPAAPATH